MFDTDDDRDITYTSPDVIELGTNFERENGVRVNRDELNASVEGDESSKQAEVEGGSSLGVEQDKEDNNDCQLTLPQFRQVHSNSDLVKCTLQDGTLTDIRRLATEKARGYLWEEGKIIHIQSDEPFGHLPELLSQKH